MGVELIRDAICDRCGKKCSFILENTYKQIEDEVLSRKFKHIESFHYNYTEIRIKHFDNFFPDDRLPTTIKVLCSDCISSLDRWLRSKESELS